MSDKSITANGRAALLKNREALFSFFIESLLFDIYFFKPLNMNNTGLDNPRKINNNRAYGFSINEHDEYIHTDNDKLSEIKETAAGELYSTLEDLKKWFDALLTNPFVSQRAHSSMGGHLRYGVGSDTSCQPINKPSFDCNVGLWVRVIKAIFILASS